MNCTTARRLMESDDPGLEAHCAPARRASCEREARYYEAPARAGGEDPPELAARNRALSCRGVAGVGGLPAAGRLGRMELARFRYSRRDVLAQDVLSAHLRSLAGTHLLDVPSSDQHTVKPWFGGKLDFSPPVNDVSGFPLLGGRIEYLDGHPAAALVYGRHNHVINLFIWPAGSAGQGMASRNGYHLVHWPDGGMVFWAVSDLNEAELGQFVAGYRRN